MTSPIDIDRDEKNVVSVPRSVLVAELVNLWDDLCRAQPRTIGGGWSMHCDWIAERIEALSVYVGPVGRDNLQPNTVVERSDLYARLTAPGLTAGYEE